MSLDRLHCPHALPFYSHESKFARPDMWKIVATVLQLYQLTNCGKQLPQFSVVSTDKLWKIVATVIQLYQLTNCGKQLPQFFSCITEFNVGSKVERRTPVLGSVSEKTGDLLQLRESAFQQYSTRVTNLSVCPSEITISSRWTLAFEPITIDREILITLSKVPKTSTINFINVKSLVLLKKFNHSGNYGPRGGGRVDPPSSRATESARLASSSVDIEKQSHRVQFRLITTRVSLFSPQPDNPGSQYTN